MTAYIFDVFKSLDDIPQELVNIIVSFYRIAPIAFDLYHQDRFDVEENGTIIQGNSDHCSGYPVYALSPTNGYNKGVIEWSVKCLKTSHCFRWIGIVGEKNKEWAEQWEFRFKKGMDEKDIPYYFEKSSAYESVNDIMTVRLDCDNWNVTFIKNGEIRKTEEIEKDKSYYFVIMLCAKEWTRFQIVTE